MVQLLLVSVLTLLSGLVEGRKKKAPPTYNPNAGGDMPDLELTPTQSVLLSVGLISGLFFCVWMSNRYHAQQEEERKTQRERKFSRSRIQKPKSLADQVVLPKIVPAKPRHPTVRTAPGLIDDC